MISRISEMIPKNRADDTEKSPNAIEEPVVFTEN
jgi:hypothetical protein